MYLGAPLTIYTFPLFEAQAIWACKYIVGRLMVPSPEEMVADSKKWLKKFSEVEPTKFVDMIHFMTEVLKDICEATG